jgi:hypothetical protein
MVKEEDQVAFHQVLVAVDQTPDKLRQVYDVLEENKLKPRLVTPCKKGTTQIRRNEIIPILQIRKIHIVRTAQRNASEREGLHYQSFHEIDRLMRDE